MLERVAEIKSLEDMKRVITEEWEGLVFEKSERWCGINYLVAHQMHVLREVRDQNGWDTKYM